MFFLFDPKLLVQWIWCHMTFSYFQKSNISSTMAIKKCPHAGPKNRLSAGMATKLHHGPYLNSVSLKTGLIEILSGGPSSCQQNCVFSSTTNYQMKCSEENPEEILYFPTQLVKEVIKLTCCAEQARSHVMVTAPAVAADLHESGCDTGLCIS